MQYGQKNNLVRNGSRFIYHLPEADALGLANYSEKEKIRFKQSQRKEDMAVRRFVRQAIAGPPKKFAANRLLSNG